MKSNHPTIFLYALAGLLFSTVSAVGADSPAATMVPTTGYHIFFGTSRGGTGRGLSRGELDAATGALTVPVLAAPTNSPSYFALSADGRHLYTCDSVDNLPGQQGGGVSAFALDPVTGRLTLLNTQLSGGNMPTYISLDHTGRFVLVANYNSGSVAVLPILADGSLGARTGFDQHTGHSVNPSRQSSPHAHPIITDPTNRFALTCDLGLDKVLVYRFDDKTGVLTPNDPAFVSLPPGSGPRHLAFAPSGGILYVTSELANTVTAFTWNATTGTLTEFQSVSTLPAGFKGQSACAEIGLHPSGRFLYASNRGDDSLAVFTVDQATGRLTLEQNIPTGGKTPRGFSLDPTGGWIICANQDSDNVVVLKVDPATGRLAQVGAPVSVSNPVCPQFLQVGVSTRDRTGD
jgi:6-phosphogluconolactonase